MTAPVTPQTVPSRFSNIEWSTSGVRNEWKTHDTDPLTGGTPRTSCRYKPLATTDGATRASLDKQQQQQQHKLVLD